MSLKKKPEDESFNRFPTSEEFLNRNISVPASKLKEIINDNTGKYNVEHNHTPPGMRWRRICVSKGDWGYSKSVYKFELEKMPERRKRYIYKHKTKQTDYYSDTNSSDTDSNDSAV